MQPLTTKVWLEGSADSYSCYECCVSATVVMCHENVTWHCIIIDNVI